ncbi:hypothetical protein ACHAXA_001004 [Cyclostephanos tholiformis]|uniref:FAD/NAD(P)-binding domain-containing protein n=1 Tax=Cyclostephanos tholiformis TaxID=382380 RepID=A0ABD3SDX5_9STRA
MDRCLLLIFAISFPAGFITASKTDSNWSAFSSPLLAFFNHHPSAGLPASRPPRRHRKVLMHHPSSDGPAPSTMSECQRMVLIGGGHAHVQVIKALNARSRPANLHVTLIDLQSSASYSGMVPGCVAGLYSLDQVQIALDSLADWSGIDFVCGRVVGMLFDKNDERNGRKSVLVEVTDDDGNVIRREIPFDVVSIDIGSTTRNFTSTPGAERYTISTRPISDLVRRIQYEDSVIHEKLKTDESSDVIKVVVVGGGAAGIELSLALRARWNDILDSKLTVTLIDSNDVLLPSETSACCSALRCIMKKYNIEVRHNLVVDEVTSSHIHVNSNKNNVGSLQGKVPYTHCIWATGAEAHTLAWDLHKDSGLDVSTDRGWICVNHHLQSISHPSVFAAGDCCEIMIENRKSPPKAGVYAVRSGPILIENLTRFLGVNPHSQSDVSANPNDLIVYHPQDDFLKLLMCGDGTALGFRFGIPFYGKWVWELKDHIDTMFMDLFRLEKLSQSDTTKSTPTAEEEEGVGVKYDTSQYDRHESVKERMNAEDAGAFLLRRDDEVDFQTAWSILREMMADEYYKEDVLSAIIRSPDNWWKELFVTS